MSHSDAAAALERRVLLALGMLVIALPFLGGRDPWGLALACPAVVVLLAVTARARERSVGCLRAPGVGALAAFVALALLTTVPLPPGLLRLLAPHTAQLYREMLPGWPDGGGWSVWRSLAVDPYGVWLELGRLSIAFGAFAVVVAYPWGAPVLDRLLVTLIGGGVLLAAVGLLGAVAGNGWVLWLTGVPAAPGGASGPFANPNHFAAWLEMVIPVAIAYAVASSTSLRGPILRSVHDARAAGLGLRRALGSALLVQQRQIRGPLIAALAAALLGMAHLTTGSHAGMAALLIGLLVAGAGMAGCLETLRLRRRVLAGIALVVLTGGVVTAAGWVAAERAPEADIDLFDPSLASRLAVVGQGIAVPREYPVVGAGLGGWVHAFRPHQAPPVEGGIWDHAHDDYLELAGECGALGILVVLCFAVAVARAARTRRASGGLRIQLLRWGLVGGITAVLVHSTVDFGLRMPANLLLFMLLLGLLVLSGPPRAVRRAAALRPLLALVTIALVPLGLNAVLVLAGLPPLSARDCLVRADRLLAEEGEAVRPAAVALAQRAVDRSPASLEAQQELASTLGPGVEGEAALRRALARSPWDTAVRDELALRLWERGEVEPAATELEESIVRIPYLTSHQFLSPEAGEPAFRDAAQRRRPLLDGDTLNVRLATLHARAAGAIERGLRRALDGVLGGPGRTAIVDDLATLLEARDRWTEAGRLLEAEAERSPDPAVRLARAARDELQAHDGAAAEETLLAALRRAPENGELYRRLAVEVYGARGDFQSAENVLRAGERNARDMLSVYRGMAEILSRRESARLERAAEALP